MHHPKPAGLSSNVISKAANDKWSHFRFVTFEGPLPMVFLSDETFLHGSISLYYFRFFSVTLPARNFILRENVSKSPSRVRSYNKIISSTSLSLSSKLTFLFSTLLTFLNPIYIFLYFGSHRILRFFKRFTRSNLRIAYPLTLAD